MKIHNEIITANVLAIIFVFGVVGEEEKRLLPIFAEKNVCRLKTGLPDGIFLKQNPNLGKFWRVLKWKMLVYFLYSHLEYFTDI
jgi:hypothetical protein